MAMIPDDADILIRTKEEINMASELLMEISKDERERAHLRSRRMFETDRISNLLTAEARGEVRGKAQSNALILELINKGVALDEIKKILSEDDTCSG